VVRGVLNTWNYVTCVSSVSIAFSERY